jgi:hypothetical protein
MAYASLFFTQIALLSAYAAQTPSISDGFWNLISAESFPPSTTTDGSAHSTSADYKAPDNLNLLLGS